MDHLDYTESSSVCYLNSIEGIQFDGRSYALYGMKTLVFLKLYIY
jgi:hypothetical protein